MAAPLCRHRSVTQPSSISAVASARACGRGSLA